MKKIIAILLLIISLISLMGCDIEDVVLDGEKVYAVNGEVHSLDVRIKAADFKIEIGEAFSVKSNLEHLTVTEEGGVLKIVDLARINSNFTGATLTVYVPEGVVFEDLDLEIGAAKLTAGTLCAKVAELNLGAGDATIECLNASSKVDIEGGAGLISIHGGSLNNLTLELGVGALNLTAALQGSCDLECGVGESNISLIGGKDDYKIDIKKGLGAITVDGEKVSDFSVGGNSQNRIEITGGIGAINLNFIED